MGNASARKMTSARKFLVEIIVAGTALCLAGIYLVVEKIMPPSIMHIELGDPRLSDLEYFGASAESYTPDPSSGGLKYHQYEPGKLPPSSPNDPSAGKYSSTNFYQYDWPQQHPGMVEFTHGKYGSDSFTVPYVLNVLGTADGDPKIGIYSWSVSFGAGPEDTDTHQFARDRLMEFLARLRAAGWKRLLSPGEPRLSGRDSWRYFASGNPCFLDSSYVPTMEEWMNSFGILPYWEFYSNGIYLTVSFMEQTTAPGKGAYLFSVDIENEYSYYGLAYFNDKLDKLPDWRKYIVPELEKEYATRPAAEARLRAEGYTIDTSYEEPPIEAEALRALAEKDGR